MAHFDKAVKEAEEGFNDLPAFEDAVGQEDHEVVGQGVWDQGSEVPREVDPVVDAEEWMKQEKKRRLAYPEDFPGRSAVLSFILRFEMEVYDQS